MQNFVIHENGYTPIEEPTKWLYEVGDFVVAIKQITDTFTIKVRTA